MKPQLFTKIWSLAAFAPLLAAPLASHADPAIDACIDAFVRSTFPKEQPIKVRKIHTGTSHLEAYGARREVELVARLRRTGARLATATCTVDRNNEVIALNGAPAKQRIAGAIQKTAAR